MHDDGEYSWVDMSDCHSRDLFAELFSEMLSREDGSRLSELSMIYSRENEERLPKRYKKRIKQDYLTIFDIISKIL